MKELQTNRFYDFGAFRLDAKKRRLLRGEEIIPLTPKEFELLFVLVKNAGKVVEKDDLLDEIWKDTFVEEGTLTRNISWLRRKLAANVDEKNIKFIETVPKRGYRFLPEIKIESEQPLVIEEQTLTRIRIEETLTIPDQKIEAEIIVPQIAASNEYALIQNSKFKIQNSKSNRLYLAFALIIFAVLGFFAYRAVFQTSETTPILVSKIAPFSGLTGREDMPSFSPDGKQIAFSWNGGEADTLSIYVKLIGAGEPLRLTNSAQNDLYPTFSPDASQIFFVRAFPTHSEVIAIPALGGAERKICELKSYASLSFAPDGNTLAIGDADESGKIFAVYLLDLRTGEKRRLTNPSETSLDNTPRFSPDGKQIAFLRSSGDFVQELMIVSSTGGEPRQITNDKARIRNLGWSADGKNIYFVSFRANNQSNLWQISASGGEPRLVSTGGKNMRNMAVSPDRKTVAFVEETEDSNIRRINSDGTAQKFIASARGDHSPHIAPDASRIAFVSDRSGHGEIWIADADGKNQRQLTFSEVSAGSPRISPDGKTVLFDKQTGESSNIFTVSIEGGEPRRIAETAARDILPAWSADGKTIFFTSNRSGDFQLWKIPANGGEAVQLTKQGAFESFAAPDGKTILYSKSRGIAGLWQISIDGSDEKTVSALSEAGYWRSWTVTNGGVYFVAYAPNPPYQLKFYDFANARLNNLAAIEKVPLWNFSGLSASADGKLVLYAQSDQNTSSIMLADVGN
ncbi:MAG TPA: winged helix-turn-helix domain-containing protein [Pyrinomonadaceae bacterium]|nr:winged helix-turn-helix domain-containing protein [Pyrinomonadaceae bacterium]